jgi:hypothetical protein
MPDQLIILLGAGASFDCASEFVERHADWRPPLTNQLFELRFQRTLNAYPLAEAAAADIQPAIAKEPVALEQFLRETLRDSPHAHRRQQFWAIPLYLQHLLFNCSLWVPASNYGYTIQPDNYNRLITLALELDEAVFVTLNYDTLLDRRLFAYAPLTSLDSYINPATNWSLIKLHGSVDWGHVVLSDWEAASTDPFLAATFGALGDELSLDEGIALRLGADVRSLRLEGTSSAAGGRLYYPALSAPLGPGDELVCPPEHTEHLRERLEAHDGLNLFVIGYSGLDQAVLNLLRESGNYLKSLTIVSNSEESAIETKGALTTAIGLGGSRLTAELKFGGFDEYAQSEEMRSRIESLP